MIVRYSLCGCIRLESSWEEEPLDINSLLDFVDRMTEHYKVNRECWLRYYQDIVVRDIVKRERVDA